MIKLKQKLKGTFIHEAYTWSNRKKTLIIGLISNKSFYMKKKYITKKFYKRLGYRINFNKEPKTYNQKIQFRKVYDKNPLYSICSDKYRVREYVKEKIGEKYLIPLHLVTEKLTEEDWGKLPKKCVIKVNHNSGPVQIILDKDKAEKDKVIKKINRQLNEKYGILSMETYYDDIKPMVIVEEFLDFGGKPAEDYKFHCFNKNGEFKCFIQHVIGRNVKNTGIPCDYNFYDIEWKKLDFYMGKSKGYEKEYFKPKNLNKMIELVKKISEDFECVRVDLYSLENKIYFGEITFSPESGFGKIEPLEWDEKIGSYWDQKMVL